MKWGLRMRIGAGMALVLLPLACTLGGAPSRGGEAGETVQQHVSRGDLELARGRAAEAEREYAAAVGLRPEDPAASLGLARALAAQGRDAEALSRYDDPASRRSESWSEVHAREVCPLLLRLAARQLEAGAAARAARPDDAVARTDGDAPPVASAAEAAEAADEALALASRARDESCAADRVEPVRARALLAAAEARRAVEPAAAARLCREAAAADPTRTEAWRCAGALLLEGGEYTEALRLLSEALRHHGRDRGLQELMVDALARRAPAPPPGDAP